MQSFIVAYLLIRKGEGGRQVQIEFVEHQGLYIPKKAVKKKPIAFDLFAGCGGFSLGFIQAGWEVVGAVEWDETATLTYITNLGAYPMSIHYIDSDGKERLNKACKKYVFGKENLKSAKEWDTDYNLYNKAIGSNCSGSGWIKNYPDASPVRNFWFGDIRKLKGQDILDKLGLQPGGIDCMMGGPPCQGFSAVGKRDVMDPRNSLVFEFGRMILELQPKTFVMENVPGIVSMITPEGIPVIDALCLMLSEGGYGAYEGLKKSLLASAGCGAGIKGSSGTKKSDYKKKNVKAENKKESMQPDLFEACDIR